MASEEHHLTTGIEGEKIAVQYLVEKGFVILERNFRFRRSEIDLIATHSNQLIFIEVKARRSERFGLPEEAVTERKMSLIKIAAEEYIYRKNWLGDIRFDVVAINFNPSPMISHIEDISY